MSDDARLGWYIDDPRPIEQIGRYTYFIARPDEVAAIRPGDMVQLVFQLDPPGETCDAERMWVTVTDEEGETLTGVLESEPYEGRPTKGAHVRFRRLDVIDIVWKNPSAAPNLPPRRECWDRCLVEACVLEEGVPVEYLYREPPDPAAADDEQPDSGWCIRGRRGGASDEEMAAREVRYVALGAVLNKDDSWLALIDTPVGSAFMRNFETGEYEPVSD
jgi:hypothetical protein